MSKSTRGRPARGLYEFEGERVTANGLKSRGLVYRVESIRGALDAGCTTMIDLVAHIERATAKGRRRAGQKGAFNFGKAQFGEGTEYEAKP